MNKSLALTFLLSLFLVSCNNTGVDMQTVPSLDIHKFMGDWYVIGLIPNVIETDATNGIESYSLNEKGDVEIQYTFKKKGKMKTMTAKAFIQNAENTFWKVQFLWPVKLPYYVIDLDEDYQYTVVGVPNHKFVWIMSRTPEIAPELYAEILRRLAAIGYNLSDIQKMEQKWNQPM